MLLKHSLQYLFARGVPGVINFASLAIFTRLLSPELYGRYALVLSSVGLVNAVLFQWLRLGLLRHWPAYEGRGESKRLVGTLNAAYLGVVFVTAVVSLVLFFAVPAQSRRFVVLGTGLLWLQVWYELHLEFSRSRLETRRYSLLMLVKTVLALGVGVLAVRFGAGASGLLVGVAAGMLIPTLLWGGRDLSIFRPHADLNVLREMFRYGLPLTATFALGFVVSGSDRLLLGWLRGPEDAGLYAVGYDLAQFTIGMLMMIVNLAGYPLVVRALEQDGLEAARLKLQDNGLLLLAVALPASAGLAVLAQNVTGVFLGAAFDGAAAELVPLIAAAALVAGLVAYHFNLAFQLGNYTLGQVWVGLGAATVNILLNLWWIPAFGLFGAAWATLAAYVTALGLSWVLGPRIFPVTPLHPEIPKVLLATAVMVAALLPLARFSGVPALVVQIALGVLVYGVGLVSVNVAGCRTKLVGKVRSRKWARSRA